MANNGNITVKIDNIKWPINKDFSTLKTKLAGEIRVKPSEIVSFRCLKKSIDARHKNNIIYNLSYAVEISRPSPKELRIYDEKYKGIEDYLVKNDIRNKHGKAVIVGSGPSGLFAALTLAYAGVKVILIERGMPASERKVEVDRFKATLENLNPNTNIQFGEGGAGTFSDGKLNTGVSSEFINIVLKEFHNSGAKEDILYLAKPHIGTDYLVRIVENMRNKIIELGGEVYFNTKVDELIIRDGKLEGVKTSGEHSMVIDTDIAIFAIGHSARDTFKMLDSSGVNMVNKPFSMGVRIEHLQKDIGFAQYGKDYPLLPAADYKLSCRLPNGKSLYTFCMCPGGYVVPAASEEGGVVTNGMSTSDRDGDNANSAILVNVDENDYGEELFASVEYQRKYERLAYNISNSYKAPCSLLGDFMRGKVSKSFGKIKPTYNGVVFADLRECLPKHVADTIRDGVKLLDNKLRGFASEDAVLTGVETRSSSPIRILRDENFESNIKGLYPIGEGAGYAGGITSASVDGIRAALSILRGEKCQ